VSSRAVIPPEEREAHMAKVRSRLEAGDDDARTRANELSKLLPAAQRERLVAQAMKARTAVQRVHWLRREADMVVAAAEDVSACKEGCSSCCHIGVSVTESEAVVIGRAIGRTPRHLPDDRAFTPAEFLGAEDGEARLQELRARIDADHFGVPCTFLKDGSCSIYEHRPLACRHLINLDVDDLLCRLVPGESIKVPYVNMQSQQMAYVVSMGAGARIADIRDWFGVAQN
jgi:Fe-S-cluster containining protein